ncbi:MAG: alanine dehydrogenase, partial [Saprospiraceae bacterium]
MDKLQIGIIREGKTPPDSRVPLTPSQCKEIQEKFPVQITVQPSPKRCYTDDEYKKEGITLSEDLSHCSVMMGVKEVPIDLLVENKTYFFFSHTIKKQVYNRKLLQACVEKNIQLLDYEVLTDTNGKRLIAFGVFAGMVGAHNGVYTYGKRTGQFSLKRMKDHFDYKEAVEIYEKMKFPPFKVILTGSGRVGSGARKVLEDMGIRKVSPQDFLNETFEEAVFAQLECGEYVERKDRSTFLKSDFYQNP